MASLNPKLEGVQNKIAEERKQRQEAAETKTAEMKAEAAAALAKFHEDRKAANEAKRAANLQAEADAAEALANETNPWNTVYNMVSGAMSNKRYRFSLLSLSPVLLAC